MLILGIDPGPTVSAWASWDSEDRQCCGSATIGNQDFLDRMRNALIDTVCIEDVAFYGRVLNSETFETLRMIGRLQEIFPQHRLVTFPVKALHFCNARSKVTSGQIAQVLMARYGNKGTKKQPGAFFGVSGHQWDAIACGIWLAEQETI